MQRAPCRARDGGRVTQDLAGAPELLRRYEQASPAARALLDVRRLGVGLNLPQAFLTDAVPGYLSQSDYDQLTDDWAERAYAELAELVHGKQAPLRRAIPRPPQRPPVPSTDAESPVPPSAGPVFRLADYLEQHGRTTCAHPPPSGTPPTPTSPTPTTWTTSPEQPRSATASNGPTAFATTPPITTATSPCTTWR
ncbi:hypothetical protein ACWC3X_32480 [Streptomyces populi]